ncbi:unnamed protein product [Brachionus calyciflorus]|uniref:Uncharacterized protein n=1 Tax=Brachionus calyciflorus TaxID=104777 RepID=A0A813YQM5_9BILA|nr:unnamed protein product [Brachionus calyciflorus]
MTNILNRIITENTEDVLRDTKAWCQLDTADYCPLVIALMSSIILLSCILIIYLCARTSFNCIRCRRLFKRDSLSTDQLNRSNMYISTVSNQIETRVPQFTKQNRPPPSYEESQGNKTRFNRVIRTYPRQKKTIPLPVHVNTAFAMDERQSVVFPEYRCLSLITSNSNSLPRGTPIGVNEQVIVSDQLFQNDEVPPPYDVAILRSNDPDVVYF